MDVDKTDDAFEDLVFENLVRRNLKKNFLSEKKYRCHQCAASYARKGCLTRHLRYECGQSPRFKCPYCSFKSKKTSHTYRHVRDNHIGEEVYYVDIMNDTC